MLKYPYLLTTVSCVSLLSATAALSNEQTTKILQDFTSFYQIGTDQLSVGEKADSAKATEWTNITLKSADGSFLAVLPWIKVEEKLFGGFDLTMADKTDITITPQDMAPVHMVLQSTNMLTEVTGSEAAREFNTSFDAVTLNTKDNAGLTITAKMNGGIGRQTIHTGENKSSTGSFDLADGAIDFMFSDGEQTITSSYAFQDLNSTFLIPSFADFDTQNPQKSLDPLRDISFTYSVASGKSSTNMITPKGSTILDASFGTSTVTLEIIDAVAALKSKSDDLDYSIKSSTMGMMPMGFTADYVVANLSVPLGNMNEAKLANLKLAFSGFNVSDQVWAMVDPATTLPHDNAELDIDISGQLRWLKKVSDFDVYTASDTPPVEFNNLTINALNLKIAGAELQTTGAFNLDNSQFPPLSEGSVNISLLGTDTLLQKLMEMGLVPVQYVVMAQAMMEMVFKPAEEGGDHLVSLIETTKDGHVTANGMPLK